MGAEGFEDTPKKAGKTGKSLKGGAESGALADRPPADAIPDGGLDGALSRLAAGSRRLIDQGGKPTFRYPLQPPESQPTRTPARPRGRRPSQPPPPANPPPRIFPEEQGKVGTGKLSVPPAQQVVRQRGAGELSVTPAEHRIHRLNAADPTKEAP